MHVCSQGGSFHYMAKLPGYFYYYSSFPPGSKYTYYMTPANACPNAVAMRAGIRRHCPCRLITRTRSVFHTNMHQQAGMLTCTLTIDTPTIKAQTEEGKPRKQPRPSRIDLHSQNPSVALNHMLVHFLSPITT